MCDHADRDNAPSASEARLVVPPVSLVPHHCVLRLRKLRLRLGRLRRGGLPLHRCKVIEIRQSSQFMYSRGKSSARDSRALFLDSSLVARGQLGGVCPPSRWPERCGEDVRMLVDEGSAVIDFVVYHQVEILSNGPSIEAL